MRVQQPVRDRNMSLWQSAVRQTLGSRDLSDEARRLVEHGVSMHAQSEQIGPAAVAGAAQAAGAAAAVASADAKASKAAFDALKAHQNGDADASGSSFSSLFDIAKYSSLDVAGWAQCGWYYMKYYVLAHLPPTYHDWQAHAPADPGFGVIDYRLPATSRILMVGDWGTHMPDNVALLRQAIRQFNPTVIIHLGDIYYSGTVEECTANVLDVMDQVVKDLKLKVRPAFFAIPGNHDYYSGGAGFYHMISKVNSGVAGCTQQASYFCLRTADDRWQFLGMDTGYGDRNPAESLAPNLQVHEGAWHRDKLDNFAGSTILLSHHQLFSSKEQLNSGTRPYLNENLYATFKQYFDRIVCWFWAHEHNFILFEDNLKIQDGDLPLKKGRLLGCSAYEEMQGENPYEVKYPQARFIKDMTKYQLKISQYKTGTQNFYNHGFGILDVTPQNVTASYYEYPSWGAGNAPQSEPAVGTALYKEVILPKA